MINLSNKEKVASKKTKKKENDVVQAKIKKKIRLTDFKIIILIILIIFQMYNIIEWKINSIKNAKIMLELLSNITGEKSISVNGVDVKLVETDFTNLDDTIKAWIKIENTNINFPIVQTVNNKFYLNHNLYKEKSKNGWIFIDYRNNVKKLDKNTIIYGHNMKDNSMFANLEKLLKPSWWENTRNTKYFTFNTKTENYIAEIVSIYKIEASKFVAKNSFSDFEFLSYIDEIKQKSIHDFQTDITKDDKLITLYTCDDNNKNRIIVQAKLIKIDDTNDNDNINENISEK